MYIFSFLLTVKCFSNIWFSTVCNVPPPPAPFFYYLILWLLYQTLGVWGERECSQKGSANQDGSQQDMLFFYTRLVVVLWLSAEVVYVCFMRCHVNTLIFNTQSIIVLGNLFPNLTFASNLTCQIQKVVQI